MKQNNRVVSFLKMFKGLFFVLLPLIFFNFPALSAETGTSTIHYYFDLEARGHSSGGSVIEPEEPDKPSCPPCALATLTQNPDTCECYCGKSLSDCLEDEVFNASQCRCEQCPGDQVVIDGVCGCAPCSQENYVLDEADCSCSCGLTASDCVSGESYLVDDVEGCRCVACGSSSQTGLTCPVADGVDANGCLVYREKTQADCGVGEVLEGCECVEEAISCAENYILVDGQCVCGLICAESGMVPDEACSSCICENGGQWARVDAYQPVQYTYTCCPSDRVVSENGELICCDRTYTDGGVKKCLRDECAVLDNYGDEVGSFPCDGVCIYDGDLTFYCCPLGTDTAQGHC